MLAVGWRISGQSSLSIGLQEPEKTEVMPVADYDAPKRKGVKESARERKYNNGRLVLNMEPSDDSEPLPLINHRIVKMPALPTSQSDAVIIGDVTDAHAYISSDKTSVLSEFTIKLQEGLKSDSKHPLSSGESIIGVREGGSVRYQSGRILHFTFLHQHFPQIGKQYVFFLKYDADSGDFEILTGYELRSGVVFPLDGVDEISRRAGLPFANYIGVDSDTFLNDLRKTLSNGESNRKGSEGGVR